VGTLKRLAARPGALTAVRVALALTTAALAAALLGAGVLGAGTGVGLLAAVQLAALAVDLVDGAGQTEGHQ
jgi:hypothetical protein